MKCLLLGAGRTSIECLKTLVKLKKKVSICLNKDELVKIKEFYGVIEKVYTFDDFYNIDFNKFDYIVRSPGLSILNPYIKHLKDNNIKLINEMELTYILTNKKGYYIGVTGSNGKSSTVSLLYECIRKQTSNVLLAGNIGTPLISLIDKINNYTIIILEISSFQLEDMHELKFDIGCILNLSINHLDNVSSLEYYYNSKFNITNLQSEFDYLLLDLTDKETNNFVSNKDIKSKVIDYSKETLLVNDTKLKGEHNKKNIKAVTSILKILGFDIDVFTIKNYLPLKYHLEESEVNGRLIVNDSKSTTSESLRCALETYKDKNIVLIFGGKNKGGSFIFLNDYNLKYKICFGALSKEIDDVDVDDKVYYLEDAVRCALSNSSDNDVILFSCGCASFDLFSSYKERGEYFDKLIGDFSET